MFTKAIVKAQLAIANFKAEEKGVTAIEYAIIGCAVSALILTVFSGNGGLKAAFESALSTITSNVNAGAQL